MIPLIELLKPMLESHKPVLVTFKHRLVIYKPVFVDLLCIWLAIQSLPLPHQQFLNPKESTK